ncbi:MAG: DUF971 domain-containing protein [Acidobacteriota bacterium]|nr:DUF971 domain-containing protein [Acidobacteriota bacterium]
MTVSTDPEHIAISKSRGVQIDWKDGHKSDYRLEYMRDHCPCATCTGSHGTARRPKSTENPFQLYTQTLKMESVESVGNYAIRILWNDGHGTGIYSFEHLRKICPCADCAAVLN